MRKTRQKRIRKKISGTEERPRLCVFRSNQHTRAQVINDRKGETVVSANDKEVEGKTKSEKAKAVGLLLAERAKEEGVEKVVFDRAGYKYHGRVKEVAEGAREGGLDF